MTTKQSKEGYSRQKARKTYTRYMPDLPRHVVVHHRDENPLNNHHDNLELMLTGDHIRHHLKGKKRKGPPTWQELKALLAEVEAVIELYNLDCTK